MLAHRTGKRPAGAMDAPKIVTILALAVALSGCSKFQTPKTDVGALVTLSGEACERNRREELACDICNGVAGAVSPHLAVVVVDCRVEPYGHAWTVVGCDPTDFSGECEQFDPESDGYTAELAAWKRSRMARGSAVASALAK